MLGVFGVCLAAGAAGDPGTRAQQDKPYYAEYLNTYHKKKQKTANFTGINIISQSISTVLSHSIYRFNASPQVCQQVNPKFISQFSAILFRNNGMFVPRAPGR